MFNGMLGAMSGAMLVGAAVGGAAFITQGSEDAQRTSHAMMVIQSLSQTSGSIAARRIIDGSASDGEDVSNLIAAGYLSARPKNPTAEGREGAPVVAAAMSEDGSVRQIVQMPLKDDGKLCDEINDEVAGKAAPQTDSFPLDKMGCVKTSRGPVAFSRI